MLLISTGPRIVAAWSLAGGLILAGLVGELGTGVGVALAAVGWLVGCRTLVLMVGDHRHAGRAATRRLLLGDLLVFGPIVTLLWFVGETEIVNPLLGFSVVLGAGGAAVGLLTGETRRRTGPPVRAKSPSLGLAVVCCLALGAAASPTLAAGYLLDRWMLPATSADLPRVVAGSLGWAIGGAAGGAIAGSLLFAGALVLSNMRGRGDDPVSTEGV